MNCEASQEFFFQHTREEPFLFTGQGACQPLRCDQLSPPPCRCICSPAPLPCPGLRSSGWCEQVDCQGSLGGLARPQVSGLHSTPRLKSWPPFNQGPNRKWYPLQSTKGMWQRRWQLGGSACPLPRGSTQLFSPSHGVMRPCGRGRGGGRRHRHRWLERGRVLENWMDEVLPLGWMLL